MQKHASRSSLFYHSNPILTWPHGLSLNQAFATSWIQSKHATGSASSPAPSSDSKAVTPESSAGSQAPATGFYGGFLRGLAKVTGHYTVSQTAMRSTHNFYEICAAQLESQRSFWIDSMCFSIAYQSDIVFLPQSE